MKIGYKLLHLKLSPKLPICLQRNLRGLSLKQSPLSKHLQLIPHRVPKPNVERPLRPLWLHRLLRRPCQPLAQTYGLHARNHHLIAVAKRRNKFP